MQSKNIFLTLFIMSTLTLTLTACTDREFSPEEKWFRFCKTYESAAYTIMSDRQHDVPLEKAVEHLKKLPEGQQRSMLIQVVEEAHKLPKFDQQLDKEKAMRDFSAGRLQQCLDTTPEKSS